MARSLTRRKQLPIELGIDGCTICTDVEDAALSMELLGRRLVEVIGPTRPLHASWGVGGVEVLEQRSARSVSHVKPELQSSASGVSGSGRASATEGRIGREEVGRSGMEASLLELHATALYSVHGERRSCLATEILRDLSIQHATLQASGRCLKVVSKE